MIKAEYMPVQIRSIDQIDLDAHGVIEASAGTGKTYTIEHLVVELLRKEKVQSLDQILVVTFTEKAVGELKNRIRNILRISHEREPSEILNSSYENFDTASIYTIHGFCNKIINDYAFENRKHLLNTLTDDRTVYKQELSRIKREIWPAEYGDQLDSVLQLSGYPGSTGTGISSWEDLVIDIALRYQLSGFDNIYPPAEPDILGRIHIIQKKSSGLLDELISLAGAIDENDFEKSEICIQYDRLNIHKRSRQSRLPLFIELLKILSAHIKQTLSLNQLSDFIIEYGSGDSGFNELNTGWNKPGPDFNHTMPHLPDIIRVLESLRSLNFSHLKTMLAVKTIHQLKKNGLTYKTDNSLISYDDMIVHVYSALQDESSIMTSILRKRYRFALVDEFQDTDMLQWAIFKTIFLSSQQNRLFIIGDPKQAIYGFRGADINAYMLARDEMITMFGARFYSLAENWRSSPTLIGVFNKMFGNENWFGEGTIQYINSSFPENKDPALHDDIRSLVVVNCGSTSGSEARLRFSTFIAQEINLLIRNDYPCTLQDIAILVTKWKEADAIEKTLKNSSIKYSFYKKEGLYQTKESLELYYILSAIANPHSSTQRKMALATRFFLIDKHNLQYLDSITGNHPASTIFDKWILFANERNWSYLFQSIMEDTGILFRNESDDHDRQILNYKSIIQTLEIEAFRNNYCIHGLTSYLNSLVLHTSLETDDSNIQKLDLDRPGVQLLTMHASKGLEFKVVFIGGGFTKRDISLFWTYHLGNQRIFNLVRDDINRALHDLERSNEEDRLFYVACTRARDRLYIPIFEPSKNSISKSGLIGNKIPKALLNIHDTPGVVVVEYDQLHSPADISQHDLINRSISIALPDPLFPDTTRVFLERSIAIDSFSGLKSKLHESSEFDTHVEFGELTQISGGDDKILFNGMPYDEISMNATGIPHGVEIGLMMHEIFEKIDFKKISTLIRPDDMLGDNSISNSIIDTAISNNLKKEYDDINIIKSETAKIIWNTLHAPLNHSQFRLCDIEKRIHEVEFYYPVHQTPVPGKKPQAIVTGYIHGFIDMIFEYQDKYYLVDWKSNYIEDGYSQEMIEKNIREMHYDLQINIYTHALIHWLRRSKPDYNYNRYFGGVFYLYLRGLHPDKPSEGIFFYRPDSEPA